LPDSAIPLAIPKGRPRLTLSSSGPVCGFEKNHVCGSDLWLELTKSHIGDVIYMYSNVERKHFQRNVLRTFCVSFSTRDRPRPNMRLHESEVSLLGLSLYRLCSGHAGQG